MRRPLACLLPLIVLAAPGWASAAVLTVPGDHATIGGALAAAGNGDSVLVAAGTYAPSTNGESFPLDLVRDIALLGSGSDNCILDAEGSGIAVRLSPPSGGRISGFTVTGGSTFNGAGIHVILGSPEIDGNLIRNNEAVSQGSGIYITNGSTPWIHHNVLWENIDSDLGSGGDPHGIQTNGGAGIIEYNLIGRGDSNGLLIKAGDEPVVRGNIFYENGTPAVRGRGICHFGGPNTVIAHNLFFGNSIAAILVNNGEFIDLSGAAANTLSATDSIYGNLDGDPLFLDANNGDWSLTVPSPAIDSGDPTSPLDPDGTQADIGPFFFDQSITGVPTTPSPGRLLAAPNPFRLQTQVVFTLSRSGPAEAVIVDVRGRRVRTLWQAPLAAGEHRLGWDGRTDAGSRAPSGVYFLRLATPDETGTARVVLIP